MCYSYSVLLYRVCDFQLTLRSKIRMMVKIKAFFMLMIILPLLSSARKPNNVSLPPYIIMVENDEGIPHILDEEVWRRGAVISFPLGRASMSSDNVGYQSIVKALKCLPKGYNYCRQLIVRGAASPDGSFDGNADLAHLRAMVLADSLRHYVTLSESSIEERYIDEDYEGLRRLIAGSQMPYRDEILSIIKYAGSNAAIKEKLKSLDGGRAWRILLRDYFPTLRATRVVMIVSKRPFGIPKYDKDFAVEPSENKKDSTEFRPWIAVKTNVLYDAALTPNIELERWFGKNNRFSVMGEFTFPWWEWHDKSRVYEVMEGGLELRLWLHGNAPHRPLTGHFLGLYGAGGYYDLEWDWHGEQGHFYSGGLSYGYAMKLSKHWNLELSLAAGYLYSPYTHYEADNHDDMLFARHKKHLNYFGPTKAKISFVWLL